MKLKDLWYVLIGKLKWERYIEACDELLREYRVNAELNTEIFRLRNELALAKAGWTELKSLIGLFGQEFLEDLQRKHSEGLTKLALQVMVKDKVLNPGGIHTQFIEGKIRGNIQAANKPSIAPPSDAGTAGDPRSSEEKPKQSDG